MIMEYPEEVKFRSMIVAPPGHVLISADFSQAETWIVAHRSNDPKMKQSLKYGDIHTETAANIILYPDSICQHRNWSQQTGFPWVKISEGHKCKYCGNIVGSDARYTGKRINHGTSYRMGPDKQTDIINKDSDKPPFVTISPFQSRLYNRNWKEYYSQIPNNWWPWIEEQLISNNRTLTTVYGHRYIFNGNWNDELLRAATAFEPQSTVAQHANGSVHPELGIRGGFIEVFRQMYKKDRAISRVTNVSHDSILVESPLATAKENAERIVKILRRPIVLNGEEFTIPVDVEIGERWGELEKIKI